MEQKMKHGINCVRCGNRVDSKWNYCEICGIALQPADVTVNAAQQRMGAKWGGYFELKQEAFPISEAEYSSFEKNALEDLSNLFEAAKKEHAKREK